MSEAAPDGLVTVEVTPTASSMGDGGVVAARVIIALAESAMDRCAAPAAMFDMKLSFISPAALGEKLTATARAIHRGHRTIVTECHVRAAGRIVASASGTFAITRNKE